MSSPTTDPPLRPQPVQSPNRQTFSTSPPPSEPTSPKPSSPTLSPTGLETPSDGLFPRRRSVMNLTASTLAGIYAPDDDSSLFGITPLPTNGANTPLHTPSLNSTRMNLSASLTATANGFTGITEQDRERDRMAPVIGALEQPQFRRTPTALVHSSGSPAHLRVLRGIVRAALLFGLGAAYGGLVSHLHDSKNLAPVRIDGVRRESYSYTLFWGIAGLVLGTALPIVDAIWEGEDPAEKRAREERERQQKSQTGRGKGGERDNHNPLAEGAGLGAEWNPVVRSIGAFVGIGFAIRRLPWQSTLQASLTLGLVNPCLWYTIDRTVPGFALASVVGVLGTSVLLGTNVVPMPDIRSATVGNGSHVGSDALPLGIEQGTLAVWVWIASVLFCSCVCFGNIGRRLALRMNSQ